MMIPLLAALTVSALALYFTLTITENSPVIQKAHRKIDTKLRKREIAQVEQRYAFALKNIDDLEVEYGKKRYHDGLRTCAMKKRKKAINEINAKYGWLGLEVLF